jgi:D-alanyl-D-alanine carboxypeptidase/D-alanyl-D-alanine-endopeptidase (penicillin-binding protein 4)
MAKIKFGAIILSLFLNLNFGLYCSGQNAEMGKALQSFVEKSRVKNSQVFVSVKQLEEGSDEVVFNAQKNFVPASTLKLFYTLAAYDQLGSDFIFETKLFYSGQLLPDGSLEGDIVIEASGDPCFAADRLNKEGLSGTLDLFYEQIVSKGITCIDGDLVMILPFEAYPVSGTWPWEDLGNYYASGAWGFNFNENTYKIVFDSPKSTNEACPVREISPILKYLKLNNMVRSGTPDSGDQAFILGDPYGFYRTIIGSIPSKKGNFSIKGSIPNPPLNFLDLLARKLESGGVNVSNVQIQNKYSQKLQAISVHKSPSLESIVKACNDYSINLYAEALGKSLLKRNGLRLNGNYPSEEIWEFIFKEYGVNADKVKILDACGLSPANLISADVMTSFLTVMGKRIGVQKLIEILPEAGRDGNARFFLRGKSSQDHIWLKSGSVKNVLNYTGVFQNIHSSKYYAFAIASNNNIVPAVQIKTEIERFLDQLIQLSE